MRERDQHGSKLPLWSDNGQEGDEKSTSGALGAQVKARRDEAVCWASCVHTGLMFDIFAQRYY